MKLVIQVPQAGQEREGSLALRVLKVQQDLKVLEVQLVLWDRLAREVIKELLELQVHQDQLVLRDREEKQDLQDLQAVPDPLVQQAQGASKVHKDLKVQEVKLVIRETLEQLVA